MKKTLKKILAFVLGLSMLAGMIPLAARDTSAARHTYDKGDVIYFGTYPQWYSDFQASRESVWEKGYLFYVDPIEWIVLDPVSGLCVSKYLLDVSKVYDDPYAQIEIFYDGSAVQQLLCGENGFYDRAFSEEEKALILTKESPIYASRSSDEVINTIDDKVFILGYDEARDYFDSDRDRKATATDYARRDPKLWAGEKWFLRTPGEPPDWYYGEGVESVNENGEILNGEISLKNIFTNYACVRPAIYLDLSSDFFQTTVTLAANNGSGATETRAVQRFLPYNPECPFESENRVFNGWYRDVACTIPWTGEDFVDEAITLYAGWSYSGLKRGDIIKLGHYMQSDRIGATPEPIEWMVINPDTGLCVSLYALDAMAFDTNGGVNYEQSTLRSWLTGEFYQTAFTNEEKALLLTLREVYAMDRFPVPQVYLAVDDKVRLMNPYDELWAAQAAHCDIALVTPYAVSRGAGRRVVAGKTEPATEFWLIENYNTTSDSQCTMYTSGGEYWKYFPTQESGGVRPIIHVNIGFETGVTLNKNDGSGTTAKKYVSIGETYTPDMIWEESNGKTFCGWYKDAACTEPWMDTDIIVGTTVLYAGWSTFKKGDIVELGWYEQDGDETNGKEPLEWVILNPATGLSVSRYILKTARFDDGDGSYLNSEIRSWLYGANALGEFFQSAFDTRERAALLSRSIEIKAYKSNDRTVANLRDKVFLLSSQEVGYYLYGEESPLQGLTTAASASGEADGWWLRSPGAESNEVWYVRNDGGYYDQNKEVTAENVGVRPAVYLDLSTVISVKLVANNGTSATVTEKTRNFLSYMPKCPFAKEHYTFNGWYRDAACTEPWTEDDRVLGNMTLYAGWSVSDYKPGDTIIIGHYEQDGNSENGAEGIEWIVLDPKSGLCVSRYVLNEKNFDSSNSSYAASTIRAWLLDEFFNTAFSDADKSRIISGEVPIYSCGSDTDIIEVLSDKVFLLSEQEARAYFSDDEARKCAPVDALECICLPGKGLSWWLRSPGTTSDTAVLVSDLGAIENNGDVQSFGGVRPAAYFNLGCKVTLWANDGSGTKETHAASYLHPYDIECPFTNGELNFCGWYRDANCTVPWTDTDVVEGDMNLYAGWTTLKKGDIIYLGQYEQDNDLNNGTEPIRWIVLDPKTGLCVSRDVLDVMRFDGSTANYADSEIRSWLNGTAYNQMFSNSEKTLIRDSKNITYVDSEDFSDTTVSFVTTDKVFLLSAQETLKYTAELVNASGTAYAQTRGDIRTDTTCNWWMRSAHTRGQISGATIAWGKIEYLQAWPVDSETVGVRPAIRLSMVHFNTGNPDNKAVVTLDDNGVRRETKQIVVEKYHVFSSECMFENGNAQFVGWFKDREGTEPWLETELVWGDITLYAKWQVVGFNDTLTLGRYPKSRITDVTGLVENVDYVVFGDEYYKIEPLEWVVLDRETGYCICKDIVDVRAFNATAEKGNNYETSDLRAWMLDEFIDMAFSAEDKTRLIQKDVVTYAESEDFSGTTVLSTVRDLVFIPSAQESLAYLEDKNADLRFITAFSVRNLDQENRDFYLKAEEWGHILRSPFGTDRCNICSGYLSLNQRQGQPVTMVRYGARPACYIDLVSASVTEVTLVANNGTEEKECFTVNTMKPYYPSCRFTNDGMNFCGWYLDAECTRIWDDRTTVSDNTTLYAGWTSYKAGDTIMFGRYEQDNDSENGPEELEWILLDPEIGLFISRYVIEEMNAYYGQTYIGGRSVDAVRKWLNGYGEEDSFYAQAFTESEQAAMKEWQLVVYDGQTDQNVAYDVLEKVSLLSAEEAIRYLGDNYEAEATDYLYSKDPHGYRVRYESYEWSLRDTSIDGLGFACVVGHEMFRKAGTNWIFFRPIIRLDLKSGEFKQPISEENIGQVQASYTYTGSPITPSVTVTKDGVNLTLDVDYTVTYADNIEVGTATVTVTGINNYRGKVERSFVIEAASQAAPNSLAKTDATKCSANDGTITGVTSAMEYALAGEEVFTACTGTTLENLAPGTYRFRYAADANHTASAAVEITIEEGACYGGVATCVDRAICDGCGKAYGEVDPEHHSFTDYIDDNNADCEKDGTKTAVCDYGCGATDSVSVAGTATGHEWNVSFSWRTSFGSCEAVCVCENNPEHTQKVACMVVKRTTVQPTCTKAGAAKYTATVEIDGKVYIDIQDVTIAKLSHSYKWVYNNDATTESDGHETQVCVNCGAKGRKRIAEGTKLPSEPEEYEATIVQPAEGGEVTSDIATAKPGDKVTITATPEEGYVLDGWTVTDEDGNPVDVTVGEDGTLVMPDKNITVTPRFVKKAEGGEKTPNSGAIVRVAEETTLKWRTKTTIVATATGVDEGWHLVMIIGDEVYEGSRTEVRSSEFQLKSDIDYTVKVVKDSTGEAQESLTEEGGTITVKGGFFRKLLAFFQWLFGALPTAEIKPE